MMQEPKIQKLVRRTESVYLADNAKNMPIDDEYLYYAVDMKMKSIEMTDKGRDYLTDKKEDKDAFVIQDLGTATADTEEEIDARKEQKIDETEANSEVRDDQ